VPGTVLWRVGLKSWMPCLSDDFCIVPAGAHSDVVWAFEMEERSGSVSHASLALE
jgi:hypothetical protein